MHNVALVGREVLCVLWVLLRKYCHHCVQTLDLDQDINYGLDVFLKNQCNAFVCGVLKQPGLQILDLGFVFTVI